MAHSINSNDIMNAFTTCKTKCFALSLLMAFTAFSANAQVSESCNCTLDTAGYSTFISTLVVDDVPMQFHVHNTFAVAIGYINSNTPTVVQNLISNNPLVTTIVLYDSGGSDDDDANIQASILLRNADLKFYLPADGLIASGAVDMFFAGTTRVIDNGAQVGVHSWDDGNMTATDFPVGHANHLFYINYYVSMGLSQQAAEDFYYFTINAAPASGIYWMTNADIDQHQLRTCRYAPAPNYTVTTNGLILSADLSGALSYQWIDCNNGNAPISGATSQEFEATSTGNYAVEITETGCSGTSACHAVSPTGINEFEGSSGLVVYPNPANGSVFIESHISGRFTISDTFGRIVLEETPQIGITQADVSGLTNGLYFLRSEIARTQKLIIQH